MQAYYKHTTPHFKSNFLGFGVLLLLISPTSHAQNELLNGIADSQMPTSVLDTLVITATRSQKTLKDSPVPIRVLDSQTLDKNHAHTLKDALALLPNVNLRQIHGKTGYEVVMQGMGGDQVLVLIDGLPLTASTGSRVNLNQYLNTEVAQIEVIQGASSSQYGSSAMGGVINVITKKIKPNQFLTGQMSAELASNGRQNISQKTWDNNVSHIQTSMDTKLNADGSLMGRLSASYHDDKGLDDNHNHWTRIKDASQQKQITAKLMYHPNSDVNNNKQQAWLEATQYQEEDVSRFNRRVAQNLLAQQREENIDKSRYAMGFSHQFHHHKNDKNNIANRLLTGNLQASWLSEKYKSHSNTFVFTADNINGSGSQQLANQTLTAQRKTNISTQLAQWQYDFSDWEVANGRHLLQIGGQWQQDTLSQYKDGKSELAGNQVKRDVIEGYIQDDWLIGHDWELLTGIRYQKDSDFGQHLAPKVAVKYNHYDDKGRQHIWRASVGQGYRVPNLKERHFLFDHSNLGYKVLGNPNLQPETSNSYQLGYQFELNRNVNMALNAYYNDIKNFIQTDESNFTYDGGIKIFRYQNVNDAITYGGDISGNWQINPNNLLSASYAHTQTKNKQTGTELIGRPQHTAMLTWENHLTDKLQLINQLKYESKHLVSSHDNTYSPDWLIVNSKANYQISPNFSVYAGVNNLFDEQKDSRKDSDHRPVDNRQWLAGVTFNF